LMSILVEGITILGVVEMLAHYIESPN
jgi:hypothetical protein